MITDQKKKVLGNIWDKRGGGTGRDESTRGGSVVEARRYRARGEESGSRGGGLGLAEAPRHAAAPHRVDRGGPPLGPRARGFARAYGDASLVPAEAEPGIWFFSLLGGLTMLIYIKI